MSENKTDFVPTQAEEIDISVAIAIYNEEDSIPHLCKALNDVLTKLNKSYEIILVDDGSKDRSWEVLLEQKKKYRGLKLVRFRRNFGQTAALAAGFDFSRGKTVITMDADLQNDPADIPAMLECMERENADMVSGWRKDRKDEKGRVNVSKIANNIIVKVLDLPIHDNGCSLKVYKREVVKSFHLYGEMHRFVTAYAAMVGAKIVEMPVHHHAREFGQSKYTVLKRIPRVILDLITTHFLLTYSRKPMHLFGRIGFTCGFVGLLAFGIVGIEAILGMCGYNAWFGDVLLVKRPFWVIVPSMLIVSAVQFFVMGLNAELNTRTYYESQNKPIYTVREVL